MLSSTTVELSTTIPTPIAMPPSDMTFKLTPHMRIGMNVAMMQIGIEIELRTVILMLRRNRKITRTESSAPRAALALTSLTASSMK